MSGVASATNSGRTVTIVDHLLPQLKSADPLITDVVTLLRTGVTAAAANR